MAHTKEEFANWLARLREQQRYESRQVQRNVLIPIAFEFLPILAKWSVSGKEVLRCEYGTLSKKPLDPWEMREEFFRLSPGDTKKLLVFLNRWGAWKHFGDPVLPSNDETWRDTQIWNTQAYFRSALLESESGQKWLEEPSSNIPANVSTPGQFPYRMCSAQSCEFAMRMTITIDLLRRQRFRMCKRKDCGGLFRVGGDSRKRYCQQYCGHLDSVRRGRKNKRKNKGGRK